MDLFVNNNMFPEGSDSNEFGTISLGDFNQIAAVMARRKDAVRLLSMLQWFIKCSTIEKTNYLVRLANELNIDDLVEVIKPIKLFVGKPFMLSEASNGTMCIDDKYLIDDNINLEPQTLRDVQENDFKWFYNLERVDQVEVILGMTKILGMGGCRKLYQRLVAIYRSRPVQEAQIIMDIEAEAAANAENADRHRDLGEGAEADYVAAGDVHTNAVNLRNNWTDLIAKYRYEVFGKLPDKRQQQRRRQGTVQQQPKKKKQKKKKQQQPGDNQRLDILQLLPLFISWKILSYLDTKTLTTAQQVNSYWSFAAGQVLAERTVRISLDKMVSKMIERLPSSSPEPPHQQPIPSITIETSALRRCDRRLQQLFERGTAIASLRRSALSSDHLNQSSLLQDVYERAHFPYGSFVLPTNGLSVFPRCPPAYTVGSEVQTPEALLIGAECAAQWLEGSPGGMVYKRPIVELQVAAVPLGRKVEATSTRQSTESLHDLLTGTIVAPQLNMTDTTVIPEGPDLDEDVVSDLANMVPYILGGRATGDENLMSDASETALKNFQKRISNYMPRSKLRLSLDANGNV